MKKNLLLPAIASFITLCLVEVLLSLFFFYPVLNNYFPYFRYAVTNVYLNYDRDQVQYMPECARYDSVLTYILLPGTCTHTAREYSNPYHINSTGLRDDEKSLEKPEIIVLGDSYTMGWGVEQDSSYAELLEKNIGKRTLNAGISSFGTARELLLLNRLDLSALKYLVVQYCNNDKDENKAYIKEGYHLNPLSKQSYQSYVKSQSERVRYKPFLFIRTLFDVRLINLVLDYNKEKKLETSLDRKEKLPFIFSSNVESIPASENQQNISNDKEAALFLNILSTLQVRDSVQLILFCISNAYYNPAPLTRAIIKLKHDEQLPRFIRNSIVINTADFIEKEDYYILDDHLKARGHVKIANEISSAIRKVEKMKAAIH